MRKITAGIFAAFLCVQTAYGMGKKGEKINQEEMQLFNILEKLINDGGGFWWFAEIKPTKNLEALKVFIKNGNSTMENINKVKKRFFDDPSKYTEQLEWILMSQEKYYDTVKKLSRFHSLKGKT